MVNKDRSSSRNRLIDAAMQLFYENGYEATGVAEILERAGVRSGSLYYFFKGKEELLLAVLEKYKELLWPVVMEPVFEETSDPVERIFGVLAGYRRMLMAHECRSGCPIAALALEMSERSEKVRRLVAENFDGWVAVIRRCLDDLGSLLPQNVKRDQLAMFVLTTMEGGVMLARTHHDLAPFDAAVALLRDYFDRLVAGGEKDRDAC